MTGDPHLNAGDQCHHGDREDNNDPTPAHATILALVLRRSRAEWRAAREERGRSLGPRERHPFGPIQSPPGKIGETSTPPSHGASGTCAVPYWPTPGRMTRTHRAVGQATA